MGKLGNQQVRDNYNIANENIENLIEISLKIANKYKIELKDVLKAREVLELNRKNNLFATNGDYFDEQMGGFGEHFATLNQILVDLVPLDKIITLTDALNNIADSIRDNNN